MVRDFQSIIGKEIKQQMKEINKKTPDTVVACVGGGSNAIGTFYPMLDDQCRNHWSRSCRSWSKDG